MCNCLMFSRLFVEGEVDVYIHVLVLLCFSSSENTTLLHL